MNKNIDFGTVADLYDIYVRWDVDVLFFLEAAAGTTGAADEVLELMSGTGRLSIPLLRHGVRLCCVDYSAEMLGVLRRKIREQNLAAEVREMDVRMLNLGRAFELILLPFNSISEIIEPMDRASALAAIRKHLAPGGRFIVTLHNPLMQIARLDGVRRQICDNPMPSGEANLRVWSTAWYRAEKGAGEALQEYEILSKDGQLIESRELSLRFCGPRSRGL